MDRAALALAAVRERPGCSAWALGILANPPKGMSTEDWRALLEDELPKLHQQRQVARTTTGLGFERWWPARFAVPVAAGEVRA